MLASASVALVGNMAFIGLLVPHVARANVGTDYRFDLPMSAIFGAAFMLLADTLALIGGWLLLFADTIGRQLADPDGLPAGILVAMIGAPYFMYLLLKK